MKTVYCSIHRKPYMDRVYGYKTHYRCIITIYKFLWWYKIKVLDNKFDDPIYDVEYNFNGVCKRIRKNINILLPKVKENIKNKNSDRNIKLFDEFLDIYVN